MRRKRKWIITLVLGLFPGAMLNAQNAKVEKIRASSSAASASVEVAAWADEITIAAAADLKFAFDELAARFQKESGHTVKLTFGSSGNFFSQIENGAPFDLFFSADIEYPRRLEAAGLAEPGTLYRYAIGRIVLWVPDGSPLDVARLGIRAVLDPSARRIAIANPRHAPYGRAAVAALRHYGLYDQVAGKFVLGENISQAAQFVQSGNAQAGFIALSLVVSPAMRGKGRYWEVPADAHPPIEQGAVILKSSQKKTAAQAFLAFLKSPDGGGILRRYGFILPGSPARPQGPPRNRRK